MKKPWMDFRHNSSRLSLHSDYIAGSLLETQRDFSIKPKLSLQSMKSIFQLPRKLSVRSLRSESSKDVIVSNSPVNATSLRRHASLSDTATFDSGYFESSMARTTSIYDSEKTVVYRNTMSAGVDASLMTSLNRIENDMATVPLSTTIDLSPYRITPRTSRVRNNLSTVEWGLDPLPSVDNILQTMPYVQRYKQKWPRPSPANHEPLSAPLIHKPIDLAAQVRAALGSAVSEADIEWEEAQEKNYNSMSASSSYAATIIAVS
ncbi:hypothetical protein K450DRAFT_228893 [Umbelopsis ramanniana AG]|uniref:Uncharacterized protein n=1 Tax=Umbelopsis ramanniana AG TaxID=1314678 RepID=A0AAD5HF63_UMBRA|nr:uncharacterized protein K450DRAFT_228893 [Umbelopsis ramanniana AG]KAI8582077.1 hypothetical protein K450DRAFT_228893 [Umbelopsis ramanniana AG]